jgi:tRNA(Ile)-lysidine synthase
MTQRSHGRSDLSWEVLHTIRKYQMLRPGEKVVVAVSGGIDSSVLLQLLHGFSQTEGYSLHVAHLNHMLRGEESQRDADFVRETARQLGLEATVSSIAVKEAKGFKSGSLQESARKVRYAFLEEVAAKVGVRKIALGHTRDDQAETVLVNLLRGAGMPGLRGIPPVREGRFIRPLIETWRREIEGYALRNQVSFVTDSTNLKKSYLRNRIRLHLLPLLCEQYNPRLAETLAAIASILAEEEALLESLTFARLSSILLSQEKGGTALSIPALLQEPVALRRRILREAARMASQSYLPLSHRHIFALEELLSAQGGSQLSLPGRVAAIKEYDRLVFTERVTAPFPGWEYPLSMDGIVRVPEAGLSLKAEVRGRGEVVLKQSSPSRAFFDADEILFPLTVRSRRPGDHFYPLGGRGKKKLKKFLIDAKVSRVQRDDIPLLVSGGEIIWVTGLRIDERYRVREGTERVLMVETIRDEKA